MCCNKTDASGGDLPWWRRFDRRLIHPLPDASGQLLTKRCRDRIRVLRETAGLDQLDAKMRELEAQVPAGSLRLGHHDGIVFFAGPQDFMKKALLAHRFEGQLLDAWRIMSNLPTDGELATLAK